MRGQERALVCPQWAWTVVLLGWGQRPYSTLPLHPHCTGRETSARGGTAVTQDCVLAVSLGVLRLIRGQPRAAVRTQEALAWGLS